MAEPILSNRNLSSLAGSPATTGDMSRRGSVLQGCAASASLAYRPAGATPFALGRNRGPWGGAAGRAAGQPARGYGGASTRAGGLGYVRPPPPGLRCNAGKRSALRVPS